MSKFGPSVPPQSLFFTSLNCYHFPPWWTKKYTIFHITEVYAIPCQVQVQFCIKKKKNIKPGPVRPLHLICLGLNKELSICFFLTPWAPSESELLLGVPAEKISK